jgi:hypothetical protein
LKLTICARTGNRAGLFRADRPPPAVSAYLPAKFGAPWIKSAALLPGFDSALQQESDDDSIVVNNVNNSRSLHRNMKIRKSKSSIASFLDIGF